VSGERGDRRDDLLADLQVGDRPIRADGIAGDRDPQTGRVEMSAWT